MEKKYDVFISCKSEDYKLAEEVYQFLNDNDIHTFLSSKELRRMKDSEYMDAISEALDSAYHLIVLASSKDNVNSKWVKFEWSTYLNEQLSDRKEGQIMTLLDGMSVDALPIQLRHFESFTIDNFRGQLLPYVETPEYRRRREIEKLNIEEQLRKEVSVTKSEIRDKIIQYYRHEDVLNQLSDDIVNLKIKIKEDIKTCPVCGASLSISSKFCPKCCWTFSPVFEDREKINDKKLFLAQSNWNAMIRMAEDINDKGKKIEELKNARGAFEANTKHVEDKQEAGKNQNARCSNKFGDVSVVSIILSVLKTIAQWFTNSYGKVCYPAVSVILHVLELVCWVLCCTVCYIAIDYSYNENYFYLFIYSALGALMYHHTIRWNRLAFYVAMLMLVGPLTYMAWDLWELWHYYNYLHYGDLSILLMLFMSLTLITLSVVRIKYKGKTLFENTKDIKTCCKDKRFWLSLLLVSVIIVAIHVILNM